MSLAAPLNYGERVTMRYYSSNPVASAMPSTTTASALLCLFPVLWLVIGLLLIRVNRDLALNVIAEIAPALRAKLAGFSTPSAGPTPRRNTLKESPQEKPATPPKAPTFRFSA